MTKLLGDFLMEHQEPFALDIYLVERGYSKRARLRKKRDAALPNCTGFAKALFTTLKSGKTKDTSNDKQLSPAVSFLQETQSSSPLHHTSTQGECSFSGCKSSKDNDLVNHPYDQYIINKRALRQWKQLLIDCMRELMDDKGGQQLKKMMGTEELWKHVCENVWLWSQDTNITHLLLNHDFVAEWTSHHLLLHKHEISREIGDAIFQTIIADIF